MSTLQNEVWLENAMDNFQSALAEKNYPLANDIIVDVKDSGFDKEAHTMLFMLRNIQFDKQDEMERRHEIELDTNSQG